MSYRHQVRVRYADCDMQGVVYNAHYLTFVDDAFDCWLRVFEADFEKVCGWEVMLKKAEITWHGPAEFADIVDIDCSVTRWGNTSFDTTFIGRVGDRDVFESVVTYVLVDHPGHQPTPIPADLRAHLGG